MTFFYSLVFWLLLIVAWYTGHLQEAINILIVVLEQAVLILLDYLGDEKIGQDRLGLVIKACFGIR
jgi:hypothetical protein